MTIQGNRRNGGRHFLRFLGMGIGAVLLGGLCITPAYPKEIYPAQRITWIIPVKPGGSFDMTARLIAPYLSKYLKATKGAKGGGVVIKNVTESGGARAYSSIYNGKPDGYTIGYFNAAFVADNIMSANSEIDCNKYTFIMRTHVSNRVINIRKKSPFKTWAEMMAAGKEKELKIAAGNFGRGHYIAGILVKDATKMPARLIAFPGSAENANALVRGDVDMSINLEESSAPLLESGEFGVLTTLSETSIYPGVQSIAQLGYPELADPLALHFLLIAPPNLPKDVSDALIAASKKVFQDKEFLAKAQKMGLHVNPLYGADAAHVAKKIFKFYEEKTPIIAKYLK